MCNPCPRTLLLPISPTVQTPTLITAQPQEYCLTSLELNRNAREILKIGTRRIFEALLLCRPLRVTGIARLKISSLRRRIAKALIVLELTRAENSSRLAHRDTEPETVHGSERARRTAQRSAAFFGIGECAWITVDDNMVNLAARLGRFATRSKQNDYAAVGNRHAIADLRRRRGGISGLPDFRGAQARLHIGERLMTARSHTEERQGCAIQRPRLSRR